MSEKNIKEELTKKAKELGITEIGFCIHEGKCAVCCLFPYYFEDGEKANISMYARGIDYHVLAKEKLNALLSPFAEDFETRVDVGPIDNIDVAYRSGLGVIGKNRLLINKNLGSYFFIGYALTNLEIEPDLPIDGSCLSCNKCINACTGGALSANGFDVTKCISYISQKKGELSDKEIKLLKKSNLIWGCDTCQDVCLMNKAPLYSMAEFTENRIPYLKKEDIENLSNKEFKKKYGNYAFSWRGKAVLLRNMDI